MVGFSICLRMKPEDYDDYVNRVIETLKNITERSNTSLIVSEFGAWEKPWNEDSENVRSAYEIVLREGYKNELKGFFALEGLSILKLPRIS